MREEWSSCPAALGQERNLGTVETEKKAEMVLPDANPLEDIANTRKINTVILDGHVSAPR
jgi:imidazolonepropionase-like amidohydrolase